MIQTSNPDNIQTFDWLLDFIDFRCHELFVSKVTTSSPLRSFIERATSHKAYKQVMNAFTPEERFILLMALANQLCPDIWGTFNKVATKFQLDETDINSFGLAKMSGTNYRQVTIGTALFLLAGNNTTLKNNSWNLFLPQAPLRNSGALELSSQANLPSINTVLKLDQAFEHQLLIGKPREPQYSPDFPATPLTTSKTWDDLILDEYTTTLLAQARKWVRHYMKVSKQPGIHQGQGYRLLMSGPSGTGKTLAAALLGKEAGKPVYRIDISNIVDKYVGETSKKLRQIFEVAEAQDWILFFDEGDALFGKRSEGGQSSNERYANQEVSYLLYKLEEYQGMIFLATNHRRAIDTAFMRRFDSLIRFYAPDQYTRQQLWAHFFDKPGYLQLDTTINQANWRELAERAEVSAAWIEKFYAYCVMQTTAKSDPHISAQEMRLYLHWFGAERGYFEDKTRDLFLKNYN